MHDFFLPPWVIIETRVWLLPFHTYFLLETVDTNCQRQGRGKADPGYIRLSLFLSKSGTRETPHHRGSSSSSGGRAVRPTVGLHRPWEVDARRSAQHRHELMRPHPQGVWALPSAPPAAQCAKARAGPSARVLSRFRRRDRLRSGGSQPCQTRALCMIYFVMAPLPP